MNHSVRRYPALGTQLRARPAVANEGAHTNDEPVLVALKIATSRIEGRAGCRALALVRSGTWFRRPIAPQEVPTSTCVPPWIRGGRGPIPSRSSGTVPSARSTIAPLYLSDQLAGQDLFVGAPIVTSAGTTFTVGSSGPSEGFYGSFDGAVANLQIWPRTVAPF